MQNKNLRECERWLADPPPLGMSMLTDSMFFFFKASLKGLQQKHLIGSAVAGFNHARTITYASANGLDTRQDDYNNGICFPGVNIPVR